MKLLIFKMNFLITIVLLLVNLQSAILKAATLQDCMDWFNELNHVAVIKKCSDDESIDKNFLTFASQMFLDVSYKRINEIFYNGKQMGSFVYKYKTGKDLYSQLEKHHLKNYFEQLVEFAEIGIPMARLLAAKVFYINSKIIKYGEMKESSGDWHVEFDAGMKKHYFPNLEQLVKEQPDHTEALAMLGFESFTSEYIEGENSQDNRYYRVKNKALFAHLLRAHELGHPGFQEVIDGVKAWNRHVEQIKTKANKQDPEAIYQLGLQARIRSHEDDSQSTEAFKYFKKASDLGHVDALRALNSLYANEFYNAKEFLATLSQLVELNDTPSMIRLGDIYLCQDKVEAAKKLYEKAKSLKHPEAQFALDDLKYDGEPSSGC